MQLDLRKGSDLKADMRRCFRCNGLKKMYKIGAGYCLENCGGELVNCPLCDGKGQIKTLDKLDSQIQELMKKPDVKRRRKSTSTDINSNSVSQDIKEA